MAVTNTAVFAQTAKTMTQRVTAASDISTPDAPTNTLELIGDTNENPSSGDGIEITSLVALAAETNTAAVLSVWLSKDSGTTKRLVKTIDASAATISSTAGAPQHDFGYTDDDPLRLEAGDEIFVGASAVPADGWYFICQFRAF